MEQDVLAPAPGWAQHLADLLLALIGASLAMAFKPLRAVLILGAALLLWSGVAATALAGGLILPVIMPAVTAAMALAATLGWRFVVSDRDKRFLRDSFALYLAPALVDRLVDGANPPALGGEEREVTLFFSDLAGFSTMSEGLKPEETVRIMNAYLGAMTEEIERAGGMVDKYIGDAIVALFGAPLAAADHGRRAVAAALACRARLALLNQSLGRMKEPLRQRIGLNSGAALIGNIGSDRRFNYTAMGDTVNLAARLEGANKVFGTDILVSESTASVSPDVTWRELDYIRVVGRARPVAVLTPVFPGEEKLAEAYAAALAAFRKRDFARTIELASPFAAMDKASAGLIKRAGAFLKNPPPADWQPVNELTEK
jgi:class 3 adenylate cyclase